MIDGLHKIHNILHINVYYARRIKRCFYHANSMFFGGDSVLFGGISAEISDFITLIESSITLFGADTALFNRVGEEISDFMS